MRNSLRRFYRYFIGFLGIFFIILSFFLNKHFFFSPEIILYLIISVFCAHFSIIFDNVIVSFEILMNFFIYLTLGYHYASIFAFLTILFAWIIKYFHQKNKRDQVSKRILLIAFFNAGMYAFFYALTGIILIPIKNETLIRIYSIILFVIINETILIGDFLLEGIKETKEYFKKWFLSTIIIESLTYSLAIPISIIYKNNGFIITFPLLFALSIFSFIGNRMSRYQENLLNNITKIKDLNDSLRKISGIIEFNTLIETISKEAIKLFGSKEIYLNIKFEEYGHFYFNSEENKVSRKAPKEIELSNYKLFYQSDFVYIYINKEKIEKDEQVLFESFGKQCEISLRNAHLHNIAIHDSLTSLYTRRFFENRLTEELIKGKREKTTFSIALIDLDNFKSINDTFGHIEGDRILIEFSNILRKSLRKNDIIARWGGDEFIVLFPNLDRARIEKILNRIKNNMIQTKILLNDKPIDINFSYSIFTYTVDMDITGTEIFRIIDRKLLVEKRSKKQVG